jgi:phage protein U
MYAQLGDIVFEQLFGPESFTRVDTVSVPQHTRINRRPKQQFTGVDLGKIKIGMHLHRSIEGYGMQSVEETIKKFRDLRNSATHLKYITGSGNVIGTFIIVKTEEKWAQTTPTGDIVSCKLEHELIEVTSSSPSVAAKSNAKANSKNRPQLTSIPVIRPAVSMPTSAALDVVATKSYAEVSDNLIGEYVLAPENAESNVQSAKERVVKAREHMADAAAKVQAAQDTAQQAQDYVNNMYTVINNAQTLEQYIDAFDPMDPIGSMNNINNANTQFMSSVGVMTNTSQPLAAFTGSRG